MKVEITTPETLKDIKLSQYLKWVKISKDQEMSTFLQQKMIEIFCEIPLKVVMHIKAKDVDKICSGIIKALDEKAEFVDRFQKDGVEFGFIPQLDEMTFGEYVDLDTYMAEWDTMDKAMSILFRPIIINSKRGYIIEDYEKADKYDMSDMTLDIVFGAMLFFYNLSNELRIVILNYLEQEMEDKLPQGFMDSLKNGVGINLFTDLQKETS